MVAVNTRTVSACLLLCHLAYVDGLIAYVDGLKPTQCVYSQLL